MADEPSNTASRLSTAGTVGADDESFSTVAAALDAAVDGDTVRLPRGTFRGGVTITKSVTLAGAGMGETVLRGGGPVLIIGTLGQTIPPTVTIRDVAITVGRTTTSELSRFLTGEDGIWALGGGIEVPPGAFGDDFLPAPGATVTLLRTRLSGNRAAPSASVPSGLPCPGGEDCPFVIGAGGGVDTWGGLAMSDSRVSGNTSRAVGSATLSQGGGIFDALMSPELGPFGGPLTLTRVRVEHNTLAPAATARGGGCSSRTSRWPCLPRASSTTNPTSASAAVRQRPVCPSSTRLARRQSPALSRLVEACRRTSN